MVLHSQNLSSFAPSGVRTKSPQKNTSISRINLHKNSINQGILSNLHPLLILRRMDGTHSILFSINLFLTVFYSLLSIPISAATLKQMYRNSVV